MAIIDERTKLKMAVKAVLFMNIIGLLLVMVDKMLEIVNETQVMMNRKPCLS